MIDLDSYLLFLGAVLLICVVPGADMVYIVTNAVSQGVRAGLLASVGMSVGMLVHTTAVVLGLATLVSSSPIAYDVLRYAGAVYLGYLGVRTLIDSWRAGGTQLTTGERLPLSTVFQRAIITNVLNPKIVVFYLAFLPQFVRPEQGNSTMQLLVLGVTFVIMGLLVDSVVALASGRVGDWLRKDDRTEKWLNRLAGVVFLGLAAKVAID
ncbi:LysE family translocator [Amycolatopsis aidingensis]|uniref:LysE family translocator n=1 Tax=Amycolatopsis aidingensis TaxID=2842453 RepID=UPI001C0BC3CC|nr:LysE family translocator [Amycolatopsis aidingensis]